MDRNVYMRELYDALSELVPGQERAEILRYYEEYFDDAGPEGEAAVIQGLGDPRALAEKLAAEAGYSVPEEKKHGRRRIGLIEVVAVVGILLVLAAALFVLRHSDADHKEPPIPASPPAHEEPEQPDNTVQPDDEGRMTVLGETFGSIVIDAAYADVEITWGEDFSLVLEWNSEGGIYSLNYILDGETLRVTGSEESLLNVAIKYANVSITVPKSQSLEKLDVDLGMGDLLLEGFAAGNAVCDTGMGDIALSSVSAEEISVKSGLGKISLTDVESEQVICHVGQGDLHWSGSLCREVELKTGKGDILINTPNLNKDWECRLTTGMGEVCVNEDNMERSFRQEGSSGSLNAATGMGDVSLMVNGGE